MCPTELQTPSQIKGHAFVDSLSSKALNVSVIGQFFKPYKPKTGILVAMGNHLNKTRWVDGHLSTEGMAKSGVFQDSMLVPLLFLISINDLVDELTCNRLFFAGDIRVIASRR